ncbi:MAG: hypothetical protein WEA58_03390 [Balneolaceae bacterium]
MFSLILLIPSISIAQSQSTEIQIAQLEQNYDAHVSSMLSNYFESESFIVNVTINAEMIDEITGSIRDQITREPRGNITMPGLPYLPDEHIRPEQRIQTETITRETTSKTLRLLNISVNVFADTSYSDQQIEFMNLLTNIAAKTNPNRGDIVEVSQISIPGFERNITPDALPETDEPDLVALFNQYMPGLFLLLIILLFVANRFQSPSGERFSQIRTLKKRDEYKDDIYEVNPQSSSESNFSEKFIEQNDSLSDMLDRVMKLFIQSPRDVALLFEYWINDHSTEGTLKAAKVIQTIDKQLLKTLEYDLPADVYRVIQRELDTLPAMDDTERKDITEKFLRIFRAEITQNNKKSKYGQLKLFRYLDHMSDTQIEKLLHTETATTAAITLDYLPVDRAANVLENMHSERAAEVMIEIANVSHLSFKEYNTISSQLFSSAIAILKKEKQQKEGLEHMMPLLQKLPLKDQKRFIEQMNAMGSAVGKAAKSKVIMPEQIPAMDPFIIKSATQHLDTQTLLHAISEFNDDIVDSILSFRPNREQKLIRKELLHGASLNPARINQDQLTLMNLIREKVLELNR